MKKRRSAESKFPQVLFHVTQTGLVPGIFELGLLPRLATNSPRVWLCRQQQITRICKHLEQLKENHFGEQGFLILRVDVRKTRIVYNGRYWYTLEPISPKCITLCGRYSFEFGHWEYLPRTVRGYGPHLSN